jgi:pimeloyl-ACP methyl ester carboxylesterase
MTTQVQPQDKTVLTNGLNIHYLDWGNAGKPVIILLHGLRGVSHSWDSFSEHMCGDYHVLALDQRGRGDSDWAPDGNYTSTEEYVKDLAGFCDALKLDSFILVGHSMGGRNGTLFTAMYPEKVSKFVIVDIPPLPIKEGRDRIRNEILGVPEEFDTFEDVFNHLRKENPLPPEDVLRRRLKYQTKQLPNGKIGWKYDKAIREQWRAGNTGPIEDLWGSWNKITCPVLIVRGGETDTLLPDEARKMKDAIPNGQVVDVPRAHHMVMEENPDGFNEAVRRFIKSS